MLKGSMNAFACLTKYLEVFKARSPEMRTIHRGLWWSRGRAEPGARVNPPEEPLRRRWLLLVWVDLIYIARGFIQFCLLS